MKSIVTFLSLIALASTCASVSAQTTPTASDSAQPAAATPAPAVAAADTTVSTAATPSAPTSAPLIAAAAPAADAATPVVAAESPAAAVAAVAPAADAGTNAPTPHDPSAVIPLIVMDEVPLTDAIKNLARQAGLNYMLDPKINYGAPDANGVVHQAPSISLRWENLTANQALEAVLKTYNLQIVDDPKTRIALITQKDPAAPDPLVTKIIQLKYAFSSNMVIAASSILTDKRSKVIGDNRTSQIVAVATEKELVSIDDLVDKLDKPTPEVLIEARIVETSKNPTTSKGIDWTGTLQAQNFSLGNNLRQAQPQDSINNLLPVSPNPRLLLDTAKGLNPATAFLDADGLSAVLSFLNTDADSQVLSTPRAVTLDNEEAVISVTTAQPIFQTTAGTQGSPGGSQVTYTNLGTILKVTPRISANKTINLRVIPEVSDIGAKPVTKTVAGLVNQADQFTVRSIDTHVLIPSGHTLVMGGLVDDSRSNGNTKVPLLGDIPGLGWAFRSENKTQNKKNLLIFITPTIVENSDFQPTPSTFLQTKVPEFKSVEFGAWESGKPKDWSKVSHADASSSTGKDPVWPTTN